MNSSRNHNLQFRQVIFLTTFFAAILSLSRECHAWSEASQSSVRQSVSVAQMKGLVDSAIEQGQVITDLQIRQVNRSIVFDVTLGPNPGNAPWLVLINIPEARYRQSCLEYESTGYVRSVDRKITANRQTLYSVVWSRPADDSRIDMLKLPDAPLPESGSSDVLTQPLDELMRTFLPAHNIPGATLAVAFENRLIYSRGFGYADVATKQLMPSDAKMRIASISKPVTAVAVLQLIQEKQLSLDTRVLEILQASGFPDLKPADDQRWRDITVEQLLHHSGGWDRDISPDPMFQIINITQKNKLRKPAKQADIIRHQLHQPLDFAPGERYAYSNFGYCLLGRIIESVTDLSYDTYVESHILQPAGMVSTVLGKTREIDRLPREVRYHTQSQKTFPAVWEVAVNNRRKTLPQIVPEPYGRWDLEIMDAHGGWVSSASDLVRFTASLHHQPNSLLNSESLTTMVQAPAFVNTQQQPSWYGCGWNVRPIRNHESFNTWHTGSLAGTSTLLVHRWDGWSWAVLFNIDRNPEGQRCTDLIDPLIHRAVNRIQMIPQYDLFADPD